MFGMGQVAACGADEDDICYMEDENGIDASAAIAVF